MSKKIVKLEPKLPTIACYEKNVFGRVLIYVTDPMQSTLLAGLTNKTTLDHRDIKILSDLGFNVVLQSLPK
jgi:hypothetical protein